MTEGVRRDFEEAFDRLFPKAVRVAARILRHTAMAEDVAAEAFARAHLHWKRLSKSEHIDAWILRVTTNLAIDSLRKERHRVELPVSQSYEDGLASHLALADALSKLPRRQREALGLRYFGGLSEAETAEAMRIAVGTVKATVHKGLKNLRSRLGSEDGDLRDESG